MLPAPEPECRSPGRRGVVPQLGVNGVNLQDYFALTQAAEGRRNQGVSLTNRLKCVQYSRSSCVSRTSPSLHMPMRQLFHHGMCVDQVLVSLLQACQVTRRRGHSIAKDPLRPGELRGVGTSPFQILLMSSRHG